MSFEKAIQKLKVFVQALFLASFIIPWLPHPETAGKWLFWTAPLVGVFFCGWVCPFGLAQDVFSWVARKLKLPQIKLSWRVQKYLQFSRYIWAGLIFFAGVNYAFLNARFYFQDNLFHNMLTFTSGAVLAFFMIAGLFIKRPFCNYFCMKGAIDGLMSVVRPLGISRDEKACIHCCLCDKVCPMNVRVEQTKFVRHPNCINCMQCISACPKKCLKYKLVSFKFKQKKSTDNRKDRIL